MLILNFTDVTLVRTLVREVLEQSGVSRLVADEEVNSFVEDVVSGPVVGTLLGVEEPDRAMEEIREQLRKLVILKIVEGTLAQH